METQERTSTELVSLEGITPAILFDPDSNKMGELLKALEKAALAEVQDGKTEEGRIQSTRHKNKVVAVQKVFHEMKTTETKELKARTRIIDSMGKLANDKCEELKEIIMKPRKEYEVKEAKRQAEHFAHVTQLIDCRDPVSGSFEGQLSIFETRLETLNTVVVDSKWEEFEEQAGRELEHSLSFVKNVITELKDRVAKDARLAELEKKEAERKKEEAIAATNPPQATPAELVNHSSREGAETFGVSSDATMERKQDINRAILDQFIGLGLNASMAKELIKLIARNKIDNLYIKY